MIPADRPVLPAVADLLHLHRVSAGWPRTKLARVAAVNVDTIAAMERHTTRTPRRSTLEAVSRALSGPGRAELHRLERCSICAHAALASFLLSRWSVRRTDDGRSVHLNAPAPVVAIARRHAPALWPLIELLLDTKETP